MKIHVLEWILFRCLQVDRAGTINPISRVWESSLTNERFSKVVIVVRVVNVATETLKAGCMQLDQPLTEATFGGILRQPMRLHHQRQSMMANRKDCSDTMLQRW